MSACRQGGNVCLEVGGLSPTRKSFGFVRACERAGEARRGEAAWASEARFVCVVIPLACHLTPSRPTTGKRQDGHGSVWFG